MRHALIFLGLTFAVGGCELGAFGNGEVTTETRALSGFDHVDAEGSAVVIVREGSGYAVTVTTDSNLQRRIGTRVHGDTLVIDEDDVFNSTQLVVDVQLPIFRGGTLGGSGTFDVTVASAHDVDLILDGSGALGFAGPASALRALLSGSGALRLSGSADSLSASLSGSGDLDARDLDTNQAALNLTGSGNLRATVQQSVSLRLDGSGDIDWWGPATVSSVDVSGSGDIEHH